MLAIIRELIASIQAVNDFKSALNNLSDRIYLLDIVVVLLSLEAITIEMVRHRNQPRIVSDVFDFHPC